MKHRINIIKFLAIAGAGLAYAISFVSDLAKDKDQEEYIRECVREEVDKVLTDSQKDL